jgi:hypothetical protein
VSCGDVAPYVAPTCPTAYGNYLGFTSLYLDLDAGLVAFNAATAPACLGSFEDAGCTGFQNGPGNSTACDAVFSGTVMPDGSCYSDNECLHGYCDEGLGTCPGTCTGYAELGQRCASANCDQNLGCTSVDDGGVEQQICLPAIESLTLDAGLGGDCTAATCDLGTFCHSTATTSLCAAQVEDGGACDSEPDQCAGLTMCVNNAVCLPLVDVGGPCLPQTNGSGVSGCLQGLTCVTDAGAGTCEIPPSSGPCLNGTCAALVSTCSHTGVCVPVNPAGSPCDPGNGGNDCQTNTCTAGALPDGGTCATGCLPP